MTNKIEFGRSPEQRMRGLCVAGAPQICGAPSFVWTNSIRWKPAHATASRSHFVTQRSPHFLAPAKPSLPSLQRSAHSRHSSEASLPSLRRRPESILLFVVSADPGKRASPCRRSFKNERSDVLLFAPGSLCEAAKVGRKGRVPRTRCGPGRPAFGDRAGCPAAKPRPTAANRPLCGRRVTEVAFLWLLSLCKQRK